MMNRSRTQIAVFGALAFLGLSGAALGQCIDSLDGTGATSVIDMSGQGNFTCADLEPGPDGGTMVDISGDVTKIESDGTVPGVDITDVPPPFIDPDDLTSWIDYELDAVYINPKGKGARCLYIFSDYSTSATGLQAGGSTFDLEDEVVVCADGAGDPPPPVEEPPVEPISTIGDGCQGDITIDGIALPEGNEVAVVSAVSLDGQTLAVCSGDDTTTQVQCVNTCVNFKPRADLPEFKCAENSANLSYGQMDLDSCRPCDLTDQSAPPAVDKDGDPIFYCWEYTNSVVRDPPLNESYPTPGTELVPGTGTEENPVEILRTVDTMLPHKQAWSAAEETEVFNGCYTKTVYLNGRAYTYTTCY